MLLKGKYLQVIAQAFVKVYRSHVELWDIKFISTLFLTTTDLSAKATSLNDISETHHFFGGGLFKTKSCKSKSYMKWDK